MGLRVGRGTGGRRVGAGRGRRVGGGVGQSLAQFFESSAGEVHTPSPQQYAPLGTGSMVHFFRFEVHAGWEHPDPAPQENPRP